MGLTSLSFPHSHRAGCRVPCDPPIELEGDPLRWPVDREAPQAKKVAPAFTTLTIPRPHPASNEELRVEENPQGETGFEGIVGRSAVLRQVLQLIETVATGDSTVLLLGETGTGKELIARAVHARSRRKERNFVKLNCAAIPTGLLESELFGHERGAFTGAIAQKIGRMELADRGSLFLDEIGDIPLELQPKLLRLLQEREFERLGSTRTQRVDVRVIAATHRDLGGMIAAKQFRSDLYYRLNVFPIRIPPLRDRPEDIPDLVRHFVRQAARKMNKSIDSIPCEMMNALTQYSWPGNIRELENVIERAVILSPGPELQAPVEDLQTHIAPRQIQEGNQTLEEVERKHILNTLKETRWVVAGPRGAATRLGLNRATLYFRMKKLGIVRPETASYFDVGDGVTSGNEHFEQSPFFAGELR